MQRNVYGYDIELNDKETNPSTIVKLIVADELDDSNNPTGRKLWEERRDDTIAQGQRTDALSSSAKDPYRDLQWTQDDWTGGAFIERWTAENSNGYDKGSMDTRFSNMMGPGVAKNFGSNRGNTNIPIGVAIRDPLFEDSIRTGLAGSWEDQTAANGTLTTAVTTNPRTNITGSKHFRAVMTGAGDIINVTLANPTVLKSRAITFTIYCYITAGNVTLNINDGVGNTTGTAMSTASTYTKVTVVRTMDANATQCVIKLTASAAMTCDMDDASIYSGTTLDTIKVVELDGKYYTTFGRFVCQLRTGTAHSYVWDIVYCHASADATDIISYMDNVYVAFGAGVDYIYGATTSWTVAAGGVGAANQAVKFTKLRNELWKSQTINTLYKSTTNPETGAAWTSIATVGDDGAAISSIFPHQDSFIVGKDSGLWTYLRYVPGTDAALNTFINNTPEFETFPNSNNFKVGAVGPDGNLYISAAQGGFYKIENGMLRNISEIYSKPGSSIKGQVNAITSDTRQLWVFVDDRCTTLEHNSNKQLGVVPHTHISPTISVESSAIAAVPQSTGATAVGTGATTSAGKTAWVNPTNIQASDDTYATCTTNYSYSDYLDGDNLSFAIPTTSTITGIEVIIHRKTSSVNQAYDRIVKLLKAGAVAGDNKAPLDAGWPATEATATYGSSTDLWGTSWAPTDINHADFGIRLQIEGRGSGSVASVDYITINVYYIDELISNGILPRTAAAACWTVSGTSYPHILCSISGLDSTDSVPYACTDVYCLSAEGASPVIERSDTPVALTTSDVYTSKYDANLPGDKKAAISLDIEFEDMDADTTLTVKFGRDGSSAQTNTLGTMTGSEQTQTLYFDDLTNPTIEAVYNSIQLYFSRTYSGSRNKMKIRSFTLHSILASDTTSDREIWFQFYVGGARQASGMLDTQGKADILSGLRTLEAQAYPIRLKERFDDIEVQTTHVVKIKRGSLRRVPDIMGPAQQEIWEMVVQKVKVS